MATSKHSARTKPCNQCCKPIDPNARLCAHCGSHQDWRGHVAVSNNVIALVLAAISVLSISLPNIIPLVWSGDSDVELSHPIVRGKVLYLTATNLGTRPGAIMDFDIEGKAFKDAIASVEPVKAEDAFIHPGSQQVSLKIDLKLSQMDALLRSLEAYVNRSKNPNSAGHILVRLKQARGSESVQRIALHQTDIFNIFSAHADFCDGLKDKPSTGNGCMGLEELQAENDAAHKRIQEKLSGLQGKSR